MNDYRVNYKIGGLKKSQIVNARDEGQVIKQMQKIDRNIRITNIQKGKWEKNEETGKSTFVILPKTYMKVPEASVIIRPPIYNVYQTKNNVALFVFLALMIAMLFFIARKFIKTRN